MSKLIIKLSSLLHVKVLSGSDLSITRGVSDYQTRNLWNKMTGQIRFHVLRLQTPRPPYNLA